MTLKSILIFAVMELLLSMTPGPAVLLVISQGMRYGVKPSVKGTLGILSGNAIYFILSALGLGAVLLASATVFTGIKYAGAAYLVYIGVRMIFAKAETVEEDLSEQAQHVKLSRKLFSQGLITQLSNPKAIVFFTALLPQFISPDGGAVFYQFILLGAVSIIVEFPVLFLYGWLAERGKRLLPKGKFATLPERIGGVFLIGTGITLAIKKAN